MLSLGVSQLTLVILKHLMKIISFTIIRRHAEIQRASTGNFMKGALFPTV